MLEAPNQETKQHLMAAAAAAKSFQSCPTLSDPMDCSLPGFSVHGIFEARVLEWGPIAFCIPLGRGCKYKCPQGQAGNKHTCLGVSYGVGKGEKQWELQQCRSPSSGGQSPPNCSPAPPPRYMSPVLSDILIII